MTQGMNPAAPHHLPPFITAPGQTDVFLVGCAIFIIIAVITLGSLYFRLHALPEHLSHGKASKLQFEVVSVMALLALYPQQLVLGRRSLWPWSPYPTSTARWPGWPSRSPRWPGGPSPWRWGCLGRPRNQQSAYCRRRWARPRLASWACGDARPDLAPRIDGQAERRPKPGIADTERPGPGPGPGRERRHSYRGIPGSIFTILLVSSVSTPLNPLLKEIRKSPMLWLLVAVPLVFAAAISPEAHTALFVLSVLAIVPLAASAESRHRVRCRQDRRRRRRAAQCHAWEI